MSRDNVRIVKSFYEAGARGDLPAMLALLAPDFVAYESDSLPFVGVYHGSEGFVQLLQQVSSIFHLDIHADEFVDSGDRVIAFVKGQFIPVDGGAPIPVDIAEVWTLSNHKIVELRPYYWSPKPIDEYVSNTVRARDATLAAK